MNDFTAMAASWDDDPARVERTKATASAIKEHAHFTDRPITVELGAGTGLLARSLADTLGPTTLIDSSEGMIETAKQKIAAYLDWTTFVVDLEHEPIPGGPYDLAISLLALHHMRDVSSLLHRLFSVLVPGGSIALADLDHDAEGTYHSLAHDFAGHHGFDRTEFAGLLRRSGFTDVAITTATTVRKSFDGIDHDFPVFLATARRP